MQIILAPMEGVLDGLVRELLTEINDYDLCVTEFIRITNTLLPTKAFYRLCPELQQQGKTRSGTPVRVQLLGQSPHWLAENAYKAIQLGSHGIDLNCGCPAKTVVGHDGGASLLKNPQLIYQATQAIRKAIPAEETLSVKIRLGWDSAAHSLEIADAVQQGGANSIAVHGRTKEDGYRADRINWAAIGNIRQKLTIPVVANGDIGSYNDLIRCQQATGCQHFMVGRGALNIPNLSRVLKQNDSPLQWPEVLALLYRYILTDSPHDSGFYHIARIKQWFAYLKQHYPEADLLFRQIRTARQRHEIQNVLQSILIQ